MNTTIVKTNTKIRDKMININTNITEQHLMMKLNSVNKWLEANHNHVKISVQIKDPSSQNVSKILDIIVKATTANGTTSVVRKTEKELYLEIKPLTNLTQTKNIIQKPIPFKDLKNSKLNESDNISIIKS